MVEDIELYIGTYENRGGSGLLRLTLRNDSFAPGAWDGLIANASFVACSAHRDLYYAVDERDEGTLSVLRLAGGRWSVLSSCSTRGSSPCFVALNKDGSAVAVANYDSGSVVIYPVDEVTGLVMDEPVVHTNFGKGPHRDRQEAAHAHCAVFRGGRLYSADLGTDEVLLHSLSKAGGKRVAFAAPPGEGPRHIVFHPYAPLAYLLTELGNKIFVLKETANGLLSEVQRVATLPHGFAGASKAAHLALSAAGDRLYASNRGHDSIAVFIVKADGELMLEQIVYAGGKSPRHFLLLEDQSRLVVANEQGGCVVAVKLGADGAIGPIMHTIPAKGAAFVGRINVVR